MKTCFSHYPLSPANTALAFIKIVCPDCLCHQYSPLLPNPGVPSRPLLIWPASSIWHRWSRPLETFSSLSLQGLIRHSGFLSQFTGLSVSCSGCEFRVLRVSSLATFASTLTSITYIWVRPNLMIARFTFLVQYSSVNSIFFLELHVSSCLYLDLKFSISTI